MNQPTAEVLIKDESRNALYLSNGMVIDLNAYYNGGSVIPVAELKATEQRGIYAIVGTKSKSVIGYYNVGTRTPTYLNNNTNTGQGVIIGGGGLNLGGSLNDNQSFGNVATGAVTLDSILGTNTNSNVNTTHTADVSKNNAMIEEPEESVDFIDGYKFLPIPTNYSDVVLEKISGTAAKWKIKIKQNDKGVNAMNGKNPHDEVYNDLNVTARKAVITISEASDTSVILFGPSSYATAYMLSDTSANEVTITSGEQYFGYYDSLDYIVDVNTLKKNTDIVIKADIRVAIENKLIAIAKQSTNLHNWLKLASNQLSKIEKAALRPYILDLLIDYLTTVNGEFSFASTTNPFEYETNYLLDLVMDNIDDIVLRNKYLNGFDLIYNRLTNVDNLKNYDILANELPENQKHRLLKVGGIGEVIPLVVSKSKELDIELDKLINSDDTDIYKISDNTPNTLALAKAIFTGNVKVDSKQPFDLSKYSTIGVDIFLLIVDSNVLKVIKTDDSLLIRKLV
jgi:hypothetical protein